jgi:hypothetical protein
MPRHGRDQCLGGDADPAFYSASTRRGTVGRSANRLDPRHIERFAPDPQSRTAVVGVEPDGGLRLGSHRQRYEPCTDTRQEARTDTRQNDCTDTRWARYTASDPACLHTGSLEGGWGLGAGSQWVELLPLKLASPSSTSA